MTKEELSALLGRPLTPTEDTSFDLYLKIAKQNLGDLLCMDICKSEEPKVFEAREGYSTVFTDVFREVDTVKVNGEETTDYSKRQWDRRSASWYNSIVFTKCLDAGDEVEITASWGFDKIPSDLQLVLAGLFDLITKKNKQDGTIQSKQVEDFRITLNTEADLDEEFYRKFNSTIRKYSLCAVSNIQHGSVC